MSYLNTVRVWAWFYVQMQISLWFCPWIHFLNPQLEGNVSFIGEFLDAINLEICKSLGFNVQESGYVSKRQLKTCTFQLAPPAAEFMRSLWRSLKSYPWWLILSLSDAALIHLTICAAVAQGHILTEPLSPIAYLHTLSFQNILKKCFQFSIQEFCIQQKPRWWFS